MTMLSISLPALSDRTPTVYSASPSPIYGCTIGPNSTLVDAEIGNNVKALHAYITTALVEDDVTIGPFAYLRPGTRIARGAKIGTYVEVKNSNVSRQLATKALEISTSRSVPDWLSLTKDAFKGVVMRIPTRDEIQPIANEQAVVEFYSR